jgi:hypothetical protein
VTLAVRSCVGTKPVWTAGLTMDARHSAYRFA